MEQAVLYRETQRASKTMVILFSVIFVFCLMLGMFNFFIVEEEFIYGIVYAWMGVSGMFSLLSMVLKMDMRICGGGIFYRCTPFHLSDKYIDYHEIETITIERVKTPMRYAGFRIQFGFKGAVYLMGGYDVIRIKKKNGRKLMISTQNLEEVIAAARFIDEKKVNVTIG